MPVHTMDNGTFELMTLMKHVQSPEQNQPYSRLSNCWGLSGAAYPLDKATNKAVIWTSSIRFSIRTTRFPVAAHGATCKHMVRHKTQQ